MPFRKKNVRDAANELVGALGEFSTLADGVENLIKGDDDKTVDSSDKELRLRMADLVNAMTAVDQRWRSLLTVTGFTGAVPTPAEVTPTAFAVQAGASAVPGDNEKIDFATFLAQMGSAMVNAQRDLDSQSLKYLEDSRDSRHVLPSIFRVPKLSAEMKFALETEEGKVKNLIFFKNTELAKEMHQQSMQFDVVSAPPPPDTVAAIQSTVPRASLVLDGEERAAVLAAAAKATPSSRLPDEAEPGRVVILKFMPQEGYIVLFASDTKKNAIGVWLLSGGTFRNIYKFDDKVTTTEPLLRTFVLELAEQQAPFTGS